jgi:quercetin dioxygenase-like cupin family protein
MVSRWLHAGGTTIGRYLSCLGLPVVQSALDTGPLDGSALALETRTVPAGASSVIGNGGGDTLVYVAAGSGRLSLGGGGHELRSRCAVLLLAGETADVAAETDLELVVATVDGEVELHAPMGAREVVTSLDDASAQQATGARSFQVLFGPHNGSTRATFFAGFIPPGRAPWHYHLYDEIVWVPEGPGRLHLAEGEEMLGPGTAFRLRPRQEHIVENAGASEMTIIGIFTPAGSPSAAYLTADVAAEYRFAG